MGLINWNLGNFHEIHTSRIVVLYPFGSPLLYVGSYLLTVEASVEKIGANHLLLPHYSFGGKVAEQLYTPVHWVDTHVRTKYWQER